MLKKSIKYLFILIQAFSLNCMQEKPPKDTVVKNNKIKKSRKNLGQVKKTNLTGINILNPGKVDIYDGLPIYHYRILRWFSPKFQLAKDKTAILYHAYCPIVDLIMKKYGKCKTRNDLNKNVVYYQEGLIKYKGKDFAPSVFVNCYNRGGSCYHRGIETNKNQEIFKEIKEDNIMFNFPKNNIKKNLKGYKFHFQDPYGIYDVREFKENSLCFYINDIKNNIDLILFK